jgi:hypothetical protein
MALTWGVTVRKKCHDTMRVHKLPAKIEITVAALPDSERPQKTLITFVMNMTLYPIRRRLANDQIGMSVFLPPCIVRKAHSANNSPALVTSINGTYTLGFSHSRTLLRSGLVRADAVLPAPNLPD